MTLLDGESDPADLDCEPPPDQQRRRVSIERNGEEYLVTINGAAFVALSRPEAEAIARRTRQR